MQVGKGLLKFSIFVKINLKRNHIKTKMCAKKSSRYKYLISRKQYYHNQFDKYYEWCL